MNTKSPDLAVIWYESRRLYGKTCKACRERVAQNGLYCPPCSDEVREMVDDFPVDRALEPAV